MIDFNIDELRPLVIERHIEELERYKALKRSFVAYENRRWLGQGDGHWLPGTDPRKMLDWRNLERRGAYLHNRADEYRKQMWDTLKSCMAEAKKQGLKQVWVVNPRDGESALVFDGTGYVTEQVNRIIDRCTSNPHDKGLLLSNEQARFIHWLLARDTTFRKRGWVYVAAFRRSIEARLMNFVGNHLKFDNHLAAYFQPALFVIANEGREHMVNVDERGTFKWLTEKVFISK